MMQKIIFDGAGSAGTVVRDAIINERWPEAWRPALDFRDWSVWRRRHFEAGLADQAEVGVPKALASQRRLQQSGWPRSRLMSQRVDVRDHPRGSYRGAVTLALTDSHASKHDSVMKSLQAGSPAIAVGLGTGEAVVECFAPRGAGYCCVHGDDPAWRRRQPCLPEPRVSTTQVAWRPSRQTVRAAGQMVANILAEYHATDMFPGGSGWLLRNGTAERFSFEIDSGCPGPHDHPFTPAGDGVIRVAADPDRISVAELLGRVGSGASYADRELAWSWVCPRCPRAVHAVHTVHPPAACPACGGKMQAALERASGLTAAELADLNDGVPPTLADIGLAEETILRCVTNCGQVIWIQREAEK